MYISHKPSTRLALSFFCLKGQPVSGETVSTCCAETQRDIPQNLDPKGEIEKAKKAERLRSRRNKLRILLKEEAETYRRELEERKRLKNRPEEASSERFKEKLKEKRVEQSLYLPKTCRRYQSYFVCPTERNSSHWSTHKDPDLQYSRACRDSTNFIQRNVSNFQRKSYKMSDDNTARASEKQDSVESHEEIPHHPSSPYDDGETSNSKYSARYARRSLEHTNVRDAEGEYFANREASRSSFSHGYTSPNGDIPHTSDNKENRTDENRFNDSPDRATESRPSSSMEHVRHRGNEDNDVGRTMDGACEDTVTPTVESPAKKYNVHESKETTTKDTRQFESEKSMPWLRMIPGDKNLSRQMFLYLTHKELKCKIEDLGKRELHACNKQYWDEALRLRDMRNKLELIREKKLYHLETLDIDEESRKLALVNIDKREVELSEREKVCMDSTMYSEDAKALWKKWVHEDERFAIKDARLQREKLMNSLEKEWQNLAIRDKEKISHSYQSVMSSDSMLQEEHKLSAAINASNMKSFADSLK
ncbi:hypothetical protein ANTPLA_LOCUS10203 [Anthophora plagiata]